MREMTDSQTPVSQAETTAQYTMEVIQSFFPVEQNTQARTMSSAFSRSPLIFMFLVGLASSVLRLTATISGYPEDIITGTSEALDTTLFIFITLCAAVGMSLDYYKRQYGIHILLWRHAYTNHYNVLRDGIEKLANTMFTSGCVTTPEECCTEILQSDNIREFVFYKGQSGKRRALFDFHSAEMFFVMIYTLLSTIYQAARAFTYLQPEVDQPPQSYFYCFVSVAQGAATIVTALGVVAMSNLLHNCVESIFEVHLRTFNTLPFKLALSASCWVLLTRLITLALPLDPSFTKYMTSNATSTGWKVVTALGIVGHINATLYLSALAARYLALILVRATRDSTGQDADQRTQLELFAIQLSDASYKEIPETRAHRRHRTETFAEVPPWRCSTLTVMCGSIPNLLTLVLGLLIFVHSVEFSDTDDSIPESGWSVESANYGSNIITSVTHILACGISLLAGVTIICAHWQQIAGIEIEQDSPLPVEESGRWSRWKKALSCTSFVRVFFFIAMLGETIISLRGGLHNATPAELLPLWSNTLCILLSSVLYLHCLQRLQSVHFGHRGVELTLQMLCMFMMTYHLTRGVLDFTGYTTLANGDEMHHWFLALSSGYRFDSFVLWSRTLFTIHTNVLAAVASPSATSSNTLLRPAPGYASHGSYELVQVTEEIPLSSERTVASVDELNLLGTT